MPARNMYRLNRSSSWRLTLISRRTISEAKSAINHAPIVSFSPPLGYGNNS